MTTRKIIDLLDFQWKAEATATELAKASHDHGPRHWRDVARIGVALGRAEGLSTELLCAVFAFAAIHDAQRQSEFHDPCHGLRAADMMLAITTDQHQVVVGEHRARLYTALVAHDRGMQVARDKLMAVCWDADRLTLGRVGITPNSLYMSTGSVHEDFEEWVALADTIRNGDDRPWTSIAAQYTSV